MYAEVAVDVPVHHTFTYEVPDAFDGEIERGHLVDVPFRNRSKTGLVFELVDELDDPELEDRIKPLIDRIDPEPLVDDVGVDFLEFVSDYYLAPIGQVAKLAIPSSVHLEGVKHYELAEGEAEPEELDEDLRGVVAILEEEGAASIESLKERLDGLTFHRMAELEDRGIVDVSYRREDADVGAKTEKFYRVAESPGANDRIGSKQQRILDFLDSDRETPLAEIREVVESPWSSLEGLVSRGFVSVEEREVYRDPFESASVPEPEEHELTSPQREALEAIRDARDRGEFEGFVLHGVTGSGKTEVYMRAIRDALEAGERALVLLPEIALTPQFVSEFRAHFDDAIAVQHSGLTPAERFDQWRRIRRNEVDIVIGARSALFAPLRDLGVIVVDEEHDTSFKQEREPRYHARDMALVRGKFESARVILGSATPSLESYHNAREGRLTYLRMPDRVDDHPMPDVEVVDMRGDDEGSPSHILSPHLYDALEGTLEADKQAILFLNRRGYSPCVMCEKCGFVFECDDCDVSLTYHRRYETLRCHHCNFSLRMPEACPQCGHGELETRGIGTEQLENHLGNLFPEAALVRLDRDTTTGKQLRRKIRAFREREVDLLAGTQMVTKGHDFPGVVTVGVVLADLSLNFPDFRSEERTFQLLTQVSGRAGRGSERGRVYVQTYSPDHYAIEAASEHDYEAFAERELALREKLDYPPHGHLIAVKFESEDDRRVTEVARNYASAVRRVWRRDDELEAHTTMLGPAMAPLSRLQGRARWQLLLKSRHRAAVRRLAREVLGDAGYFEPGGPDDVRVLVDVDPVNLL